MRTGENNYEIFQAAACEPGARKYVAVVRKM